MKSRTILCGLLVLPLLLAVVIPAHAQKGNPQAILKQYVSELQNNPNDIALLEKIINHVRTMKPAPRVPEEARRHYVMAVTLLKNAKDMKDYSAAVEEFKAALRIAPWWPEAYRNLGLASESAEQYEEAIAALRLYILTRPKQSDARNAQDEIYVVEAKQKTMKDRATADAQARRAEAAAKRQAEEQQRRVAEERQNISRRLSGVWRTINCGQYEDFPYRVMVNGNVIEITSLHDLRGDMDIYDGTFFRGTIDGLTIQGTSAYDWRVWPSGQPRYANGIQFTRPMRGTISPDGGTIHLEYGFVTIRGTDANNNVLRWEEITVKRDIARVGN
jgi:tetratricopeptide (TPR) repeat protein